MQISTEIKKIVKELKRSWLIVLIISLIVYLNYVHPDTNGRADFTAVLIKLVSTPAGLGAVAAVIVAVGGFLGPGGFAKIIGFILLFIGFMFVFTAGLFGSETAKFILIIAGGIFMLKMISGGSGTYTREQLEPVYRIK